MSDHAGYDPEYPYKTPAPQGQPPRKHHRIRAALVILAALALGIIVSVIVTAGSSKTVPPASSSSPSASTAPAAALPVDPNGEQCPDLSPDGYCPGDAPASPTPGPVTTITFTVTGTGYPSITYGSDSDEISVTGGNGPLGDGVATPWTAKLAFDATAEYYDINAQLEGSGTISCKITASGPGDTPLTVSSGHASGGYSICSAQAAPGNTDGTSWTDEG